MRVRHHTHDLMVGWGFSLAYGAAMMAGLAWEASRLEAIRGILLSYICAPAFVIGVALLLAAHFLPLADPRPGRS